MVVTSNGMMTMRTGGVALWRQIADDLERAIVQGELPTGARLPGEVDIATRFSVNRHTVRRALAELSSRGLVRAARGSGTYVEPTRLPYPIHAHTRFSEIVGAAGRQAGGRLVGSAVEEASEHVARRLAITPGERVIRLDILRSVDRVPVSIGTTWLPAARVPKAARLYRATRSITRTLERAGISEYRRHDTRVSAAIVEAADAARLRLAPGRPLLVVDGVDVTPDGRPILTTRGRFAADRIELVIES
jgi:GntR family transcriptional regulator, phosphonate transport system regulatory protein